jgi:hypothetical protein
MKSSRDRLPHPPTATMQSRRPRAWRSLQSLHRLTRTYSQSKPRCGGRSGFHCVHPALSRPRQSLRPSHNPSGLDVCGLTISSRTASNRLFRIECLVGENPVGVPNLAFGGLRALGKASERRPTGSKKGNPATPARSWPTVRLAEMKNHQTQHGTTGGYCRHLARGQPTCQRCGGRPRPSCAGGSRVDSVTLHGTRGRRQNPAPSQISVGYTGNVTGQRKSAPASRETVTSPAACAAITSSSEVSR